MRRSSILGRLVLALASTASFAEACHTFRFSRLGVMGTPLFILPRSVKYREPFAKRQLSVKKNVQTRSMRATQKVKQYTRSQRGKRTGGR